MKAYLIDANQKTITPAEIAGLDDVKKLIGYDSIDSDEVDASGDRLYFDESCFLRDQTGKGRFKLDNLVCWIDCNGIRADGPMVVNIEPVAGRFAAFGSRYMNSDSDSGEA